MKQLGVEFEEIRIPLSTPGYREKILSYKL